MTPDAWGMLLPLPCPSPLLRASVSDRLLPAFFNITNGLPARSGCAIVRSPAMAEL
jgi:hypothetical protein